LNKSLERKRHWIFGDTILLRGILKGKLWWACPAYVVQDTHELIAFYWPVSTPTRSPVRRPTVEDELYNRVELEDRNWTDHDVLSLITPGSGHSIDLMWHAGTRNLRCWYVHLQEPLRRNRLGFDTMDQMLDIVISPDKLHWSWKDEGEFSEAETIGVYSPGLVKSIRGEAERVISLLESNASPFCDGWEDWIPPVEWRIPRFPAGWEILPIEEN
jgi:hypothetical protein